MLGLELGLGLRLGLGLAGSKSGHYLAPCQHYLVKTVGLTKVAMLILQKWRPVTVCKYGLRRITKLVRYYKTDGGYKKRLQQSWRNDGRISDGWMKDAKALR